MNWKDPIYTGDMFEKIVATLLLGDKPRTLRVPASQGDGGVDILVPVGDGEIDVYQCKHFTSRIRWDQVTSSLDRLSDGVWHGRKVRDWYLVVPQQATTQKLDMFAKKTKAMPFDCHWFGEDNLNQLIIKYPAVVPYYVGDGRAQVDRLVEDWTNVAKQIGAGQSPSIDAIGPQLRDIVDALDRQDPHLRYALSIKPHPPTSSELQAPGLITAQVIGWPDQHITVFVYARYRGAAEDAADRLQIKFSVIGETAQNNLERLLSVGGRAGLTLGPDDVTDIETPRLGVGEPPGRFTHMSIGPHLDRAQETMRVALRSPGTETVVLFKRESRSQGAHGATSVWRSPAAMFEIEFVADRRIDTLKMSFRSARSMAGLAIEKIAEDMDMLRAGIGATEIAFATASGPTWTDGQPIEGSLVEEDVVGMLDALRVIQEHTTTSVTIPDEFANEDIATITEFAAFAAKLHVTRSMAGQSLEVEVPETHVHPGAAFDLTKSALAFTQVSEISPEIQLPHQTIDLVGTIHHARSFRSLRATSVTDPAKGKVMITFEPDRCDFYVEKRLDDHQVTSPLLDTVMDDLTNITEPVSIQTLWKQLAQK